MDLNINAEINVFLIFLKEWARELGDDQEFRGILLLIKEEYSLISDLEF
jgi:hypothetical protein